MPLSFYDVRSNDVISQDVIFPGTLCNMTVSSASKQKETSTLETWIFCCIFIWKLGVPVDIAVSHIITLHIKIIKHKTSPPTMDTIKIAILLFALLSDKLKSTQLKSLKNHWDLHQINSSQITLWSSWKMCICKHIEVRVSRQKSSPNKALPLSLIVPGLTARAT